MASRIGPRSALDPGSSDNACHAILRWLTHRHMDAGRLLRGRLGGVRGAGADLRRRDLC